MHVLRSHKLINQARVEKRREKRHVAFRCVFPVENVSEKLIGRARFCMLCILRKVSKRRKTCWLTIRFHKGKIINYRRGCLCYVINLY